MDIQGVEKLVFLQLTIYSFEKKTEDRSRNYVVGSWKLEAGKLKTEPVITIS